MSAVPDTAKSTPPYVPFPTFKTFIDQISDTVVPTKVDRHVLSGFSGTARRELIPALKYLGLIADDATTTHALKTLVEAKKTGKTEWQHALRERLDGSYKDILPQINLENGTIGEVTAAFKAVGCESGVADKSIRFLLRALQDAGVVVSPHITKRRSGNGQASKKPRPKKSVTPPEEAAKDTPPKAPPLIVHKNDGREPLPAGFERLPIPGRPGAYIQYPTDLEETDCQLFEASILTLRVFLKAKGGSP
jgi:hypothetical protein